VPKYVDEAQGGDWGNAVSEQMALQAPPGLLGISTNMSATVPADIARALAYHEPPPASLSAEERNAWDQLDFFHKKGLGYANEVALRPQTLYAIADSPVGLAAWILDHDARSQEMIARVFDGKPEGLTRDDILDNITLYWLTNTAVSSARLYWDNRETAKSGFFDVKNVKIPVAVSVFPDEIYAAPRSWAERAYPKLIYYNKLDEGGHFAAWSSRNSFLGRSERRSSRCGQPADRREAEYGHRACARIPMSPHGTITIVNRDFCSWQFFVYLTEAGHLTGEVLHVDGGAHVAKATLHGRDASRQSRRPRRRNFAYPSFRLRRR